MAERNLAETNTNRYVEPKQSEASFIMMIRDWGPDGPLRIHPGNVGDIGQRLADMQSSTREVVDVLVDTIKSQKNILDYNGCYIAYLLEQITEDQFEAEAENFAFEPVEHCDIQQLMKKTAILLQSTGLSFSSQELADVFRCHEADVQEALQSLASRQLVE
jgi:hypothetical protein